VKILYINNAGQFAWSVRQEDCYETYPMVDHDIDTRPAEYCGQCIPALAESNASQRSRAKCCGHSATSQQPSVPADSSSQWGIKSAAVYGINQ
jgi:hypothetical protein